MQTYMIIFEELNKCEESEAIKIIIRNEISNIIIMKSIIRNGWLMIGYITFINLWCRCIENLEIN